MLNESEGWICEKIHLQRRITIVVVWICQEASERLLAKVMDWSLDAVKKISTTIAKTLKKFSGGATER